MKPAAGAPVTRSFTTISGRVIDELYTPDTIAGTEYATDIADPGQLPYTRGIHAMGYGGKLRPPRQLAGSGPPEDTNARDKQLLDAGGTGLSAACDLPTRLARH